MQYSKRDTIASYYNATVIVALLYRCVQRLIIVVGVGIKFYIHHNVYSRVVLKCGITTLAFLQRDLLRF